MSSSVLLNKAYITHRNVTPEGYFDYSGTIRKDAPVPFQFEIYDYAWAARTAQDYWLLPFYATVVYLVVIFGLQHWMRNRRPYKLKNELFLWNAAIAIFSICGFTRTAPEFLRIFGKPEGFYRSVCVLEGYSYQTVFWSWLFVLSKYVELIDTVFIVLRKKPLVVLQWYHHFITVITSWLIVPSSEPITVNYFVVMNFGVHSMMYTYFALKALEVKVPRLIAKFVTSCQFAQMVTALIASIYSAVLYYTGVPCYRDPFSLKISLAVAISFNILFGELFYKSVIQKRRRKME